MISIDIKKSILQEAFSGAWSSDLSSWNKKTIKELCNDICTGNSISENIKKTKYMNLEDGYNYIGTKDLEFDHSFNYENGVKIPYDEPKFKYANINDILLCIEGGSAGRKIGMLEEKVCYGNKLCKFETGEEILPKFLYYYLQSPIFLKNFYDNLSGIIGGVSIDKIRKIEMKYPRIEEQKKIVEKLDELMVHIVETNQIEEEINTIKTQFAEDIKKSILQEAFSGAWSNDLSNWNKKTIKELCNDICTGNSISENIKKTKYMNLEDGYNYIGTKDLELDHSFNYENGVKIPYDEPKFKYANINDILLCIEGGSAGRKIGMLEEKVCYGNKLCKFETGEEILPKFLYYYLQSPIFLKNFYDNLSGIIGGVSIDKIRKIEMKYPRIEEQKIMVEKLDEIIPIISEVKKLCD